MKNSREIESLIKLIKKIHKKEPELRFGQIIEHATHNLIDLFYIENDELAQLLIFKFRIKK